MKKLLATAGLLAMASASHALDPQCNNDGVFISYVPFAGGQVYIRCDLQTPILTNRTLEVVSTDPRPQYNGVPIVWTLPGIVVVGNGNAQNADPATVARPILEIDAGAHVAGAVNSNSALVISRGAQIKAVGDDQNPIIFSSLDDDFELTNYPADSTGEWGGVVLAGYGESNECPSSGGVDGCTMEGVSSNFYYGNGANYPNSSLSSGIMSHVVITEGGHTFEQDSEINGLTLYAVTNNTTLNNIHINENTDDGIEFFGGNVNVEDLWLTCNKDDSVDWDRGYQGTLTDVSITQEDGVGHAFELASHPSDASPRSDATVQRATLSFIGTSTPSNVPFRLKEFTDATFEDVLVESGYDTATCDNFSGSGAVSATDLQYGCTSVSLPPSSSASGSTAGASFWTAPNCP